MVFQSPLIARLEISDLTFSPPRALKKKPGRRADEPATGHRARGGTHMAHGGDRGGISKISANFVSPLP
eukprot:scaffold54763_cov54-Phaeocystis_antarctica.AAC.1